MLPMRETSFRTTFDSFSCLEEGTLGRLVRIMERSNVERRGG